MFDFGKPEAQCDSAEFIDKISRIKEDILSGKMKPDETDYPRKDVIESWIRSSNYGLDHKSFKTGPVMNPSKFQKLLQEKKSFIEIANKYIDKIEGLLDDVTLKIFLSDKDGVILYMEEKGNTNVDYYHQMEPGFVWTEETIGTCAHELCILKETPVQIIGPEHYSNVFRWTVAFSAPIFDIDYKLIGTITVGYYVPDGQVMSTRNIYARWLVTSLAQAVQNEIWMAARNETLRAALNDTNEAVLTVNSSGLITQSNAAAAALLQLDYKVLEGMNIYDLWELPSSFLTLVRREPHKGMTVKCKYVHQKHKLISAQLVEDNEGFPLGYVLKFDTIKIRTKTETKNQSTRFSFDNIIGQDPRWNMMISQIKRFTKSEANILLIGESGSGKEVLSQAIHNHMRPDGPFMAVNCAAIPSNLIESELFGYEGGSFTGAVREGRPGKIEMAANGTLFLDEIGDMPMDIQPTLLRVLEDKKIMRIGGSKYIDVDFHLIAATNQNLLQLIKEKKFREDLYYRLAVFKIAIPPLRERGADIVRLARFFIEKIAQKQKIIPPILSDDAIYCLLQYKWPGNVRELENTMLYAMNTFVGGIIRLADLPREVSGLPSEFPDYEYSSQQNEDINEGNDKEQTLSFMDTVEKNAIIQAMKQTNQNIGKAADVLGISRSTLYRKIRLYDIPGK